MKSTQNKTTKKTKTSKENQNRKNEENQNRELEGANIPGRNDRKTGFIGGLEMNTTETKLFDKEVIGIRALRANLTDFITKVTSGFQEVLAGNTAVKGGKTVSIIPTEMLEEVLTAYKFKPVVNINEEANSYEIIVNEIGAFAGAETMEETLEILIDNITMLTEDYFEKLETYKGIPNMRKMLPYYLRVRHCETVEDIMNVLSLETI